MSYEEQDFCDGCAEMLGKLEKIREIVQHNYRVSLEMGKAPKSINQILEVLDK
jgi:hypothetical protein